MLFVLVQNDYIYLQLFPLALRKFHLLCFFLFSDMINLQYQLIVKIHCIFYLCQVQFYLQHMEQALKLVLYRQDQHLHKLEQYSHIRQHCLQYHELTFLFRLLFSKISAFFVVQYLRQSFL